MRRFLRISESIRRRWHRSRVRIDSAGLEQLLSSLGSCPAGLLLVHSSLSSCGFIVGGRELLLSSIRQFVGNGSLAMPTHSYCYQRAAEIPPEVFDVCSTPSVVGALSDFFWKQPGVKRSVHPTHSVACEGSLASEICRDHLTPTPCGTGTPYERLVQHDASVLMFGVSLDAYTLFHTAEHAADVPYLYEERLTRLAYRDQGGQICPYFMRRQNMKVERRFADTEQWLLEQGLISSRRLGSGTVLFIPSALRLHNATVERLRTDPWFLVADAHRQLQKG